MVPSNADSSERSYDLIRWKVFLFTAQKDGKQTHSTYS